MRKSIPILLFMLVSNAYASVCADEPPATTCPNIDSVMLHNDGRYVVADTCSGDYKYANYNAEGSCDMVGICTHDLDGICIVGAQAYMMYEGMAHPNATSSADCHSFMYENNCFYEPATLCLHADLGQKGTSATAQWYGPLWSVKFPWGTVHGIGICASPPACPQGLCGYEKYKIDYSAKSEASACYCSVLYPVYAAVDVNYGHYVITEADEDDCLASCSTTCADRLTDNEEWRRLVIADEAWAD